MKRESLAAAAAVLSACGFGDASAASAAWGRWEGAVRHLGAELSFVVDIEPAARGLRGVLTMRGPIPFSIPLDEVRVSRGAIHFERRSEDVTLSFDGSLDDSSIAGELHAGPLVAPFTLRRKSDVPARPYSELAIRFSSGPLALSGTLLEPSAPGPHPAIVFFHGSHSPRREDLWPYAEMFARAGFAGFVYDKRNVADEPNGPRRYSMEEIAADAMAAIDAIRSRPEIDAARIG
ncbi:MAG TPA: hypothetical protein VKE69_06405, partial [Planctomycetota bacterium]|nr:hypothetical protein [Planctomycetota bacterium]